MRLWIMLVALAVTFARAAPLLAQTEKNSCLDTAQPAGTTQTYSLRSGGFTRTFDVHLPASYESDRAAALVVAFHGRGQTPQQLEAYSGLFALDAIVAVPAGVPGTQGKPSWSPSPFEPSGVDDYDFTDRLVTMVERDFCVNPATVYAVGKSDGGGMAAALACRDANRFDAIASVAGAYYPIEGGCRPSRPISILEFHGTADTVIPLEGSEKRKLPVIDNWLREWGERDSCAATPDAARLTPTVTEEAWSSCANGARVVEFRILGGGHTWPGALAESGPGPVDESISATAEIARFFKIGVSSSATHYDGDEFGGAAKLAALRAARFDEALQPAKLLIHVMSGQ